MNIHFKRLMCILLVITLMFTMTGCAQAAGAIFGFVHRLFVGLSNLVVAGICYLVEGVTGPFVEKTGKCSCSFYAWLFRAWNGLVDPGASVIDWRELRAEDMSFHDDHLERMKEAGILTEKVIEGDRYLSGGGKQPGKNEIWIKYDLEGGYAGPEDQIVKVKGTQKVSKDIPVRPGYHFLGWARVFSESDELVVGGSVKIQEDGSTVTQKIDYENKPLYFPGKKVDEKTGRKFSQDTTLHAVWVENRIPFELEINLDNFDEIRKENYKTVLEEHKYEIEHVKKVGKNTPYVTITCSCGMKVTENHLSEEQFADIWSRSTSQKKGDAEREKLRKLYNAQYIGPVALYLNTSYYADELTLDDLLDFAGDIGGKVESLAEKTQEFTEKVNNARPGEDLAKQFFDQINFPMEELGEAAEKAGDIASKASFAISILQAGSDFFSMLDADAGVLEQTKSMLNTVENISSFAGCGDLVSPVIAALTEGLDLIGKVAENENKKNNTISNVFTSYSPKASPYLNDIFGNSLIHLDTLVTTNETGCYCKHNHSSCNFTKGSGKPLENAPSVFEVIYRMNTTINQPMNDGEKELVLFYLAERSEHELYEACGLTLQAYLNLVNE